MRCTAAFVLASCGRIGFEGVGADPDATTGGPDGPGMVQVIAGQPVTQLVPAAGLLVWSNRVDGTIDEITTTREDGTAELRVEAGGWVSAYFEDLGAVASRLGVKPGDKLRFGEDSVPACGNAGDFDVSYRVRAQASRYSIGNGCEVISESGLSGQVITTTIAVPAAPGGDYDLTVNAYDPTGVLLGTVLRKGVTLAAGASADLVDVPWQPPVTRTVGVRGIPTDVSSGSLFATFSTGDVTWRNAGEDDYPATIANQVADAAFQVADVGATRMSLRATLSLSGARVGSALVVSYADSPIATLDLPALPAVPINVGFDDAAGRVSWELSPGGETEHTQLILSAADGAVGWSLLVPPDTTTITLPAQPPAVPALFPLEGVEMATANDSAIDGWDDARQRFDRDLPIARLFSDVQPGATGTIAGGFAATGGLDRRPPRRPMARAPK